MNGIHENLYGNLKRKYYNLFDNEENDLIFLIHIHNSTILSQWRTIRSGRISAIIRSIHPPFFISENEFKKLFVFHFEDWGIPDGILTSRLRPLKSRPAISCLYWAPLDIQMNSIFCKAQTQQRNKTTHLLIILEKTQHKVSGFSSLT